ncbi:MAG: Rossmann-like and DUF2520 domain-containing protein [Bacteroidota bacterium]
MSTVAIIGYGNVGFHLERQLNSQHRVSVFARDPKESHVNSLSTFKAPSYDFVIITVTDDHIATVSNSFTTESSIVLHTSGVRPLDDLSNHERKGVLYPLQTFSRDHEVDFAHLKIFIEGTAKDLPEILALAKSLGPNVQELESLQRSKLHLAAVFACNFSNYMYHIAEKLLSELNLEFSDIQSLVEATLAKSLKLGPGKSQTGPAKRGDVSTLARHEKLIDDEEIKELYQMISRSIQKWQ